MGSRQHKEGQGTNTWKPEVQSAANYKYQALHFPRTKLLWVQQISSIHHKLSFNVIREICSYLEADFTPRVLPGISGHTLRLYDLLKGRTTELSLSKSLSQGTVYCVVDDQAVFCAGGSPASSNVYSVDIYNAQVTRQKPMITSRTWPGIIRFGRFVYIFGGNPLSMISCEKYSLASKSWISLPDMHYPRYGFCPSEYMGEVYLPDVYHSHKVLERFNLLSEQFRTLQVSLSSFDPTNSVSFIVNGGLIVMTGKQIGRWRIESAETSFQVLSIDIPDWSPLSSSSPILIGRKVFWVVFSTGALMTFTLDPHKVKDKI